MSDPSSIYYQYAANYQSLDDVKSAISDTISLQQDVNQVFKALQGVYVGTAAAALQSAHQQINRELEELLNLMESGVNNGAEQQDLMQLLDHQLAGGF